MFRIQLLYKDIAQILKMTSEEQTQTVHGNGLFDITRGVKCLK